jgi:hypothetical protein
MIGPIRTNLYSLPPSRPHGNSAKAQATPVAAEVPPSTPARRKHADPDAALLGYGPNRNPREARGNLIDIYA